MVIITALPENPALAGNIREYLKLYGEPELTVNAGSRMQGPQGPETEGFPQLKTGKVKLLEAAGQINNLAAAV